MKLFSVKVGVEIYYVVADDYAQAEKKFLEKAPGGRAPAGSIPEKIALVGDEAHLVL